LLWKVCVVIPAKNEGQGIRQVISDVRAAFDPQKFAPPLILVVDDSTDDTRRHVQEADARVIIGGGRGLGAAMYLGLKEAVTYGPDFIVTIDGDGQADAKEIGQFLQPLIDDQADLVLGSRFQKPGLVHYRYRWRNRLGTVVLARILRSFTKLKITDSHGGIRAMRRAVAAELEMLGTHTYVQETIIDAAEKGFRIIELPSVWKKRGHGGSRVVSSIPRYVFYTFPILMLRSGQHIRLLYSAGIGLVLFASVYFFTVLAEAGFNIKATGARVPAFTFIALLYSLGFQFFFFGLVLQLTKQIKYRVDQVSPTRRAELEGGGANSILKRRTVDEQELAGRRDWDWETGPAARGGGERAEVR
jgi:glycosyltransferase involved in cell wall biosynthesis